MNGSKRWREAREGYGKQSVTQAEQKNGSKN
jgi:hypothetical protein